ncbi:MAG TPA: hypothetical protein VFG46_29290 [Chryseolinea sp.]|nr:hypothetical protein [Chryseolinea sp.]
MTYQRFPFIIYGTMTFNHSVPDFNQPFDPRDSDEPWVMENLSTLEMLKRNK